MKTRIAGFNLKATKIFKPELDKGEKNPYTSGEEIGNPYMKDVQISIEEEDIKEVLELLESKGYDVSTLK